MDAEILEAHKENIQPLVSGRSASMLGSALQEHKEVKRNQKEEFEFQLRNEDELDDPLQTYWDYVQWTHNAYPQGSNTESGLLNLLERCTSRFRDVDQYKNDVRYLKLWLEYKDYSDSPRDIFIYLAKKEIGSQLALYYEAFAQYLEIQGSFQDAFHVFEMGINKEARPLKRLLREFSLFKSRWDLKDKPNGSSLYKNALSLKSGTAVPRNASEMNVDESRKRKFQIFEDGEEGSVLKQIFNSTSDTKLGTVRLRTKENRSEATQWAGEIIKQKIPITHKGTKIEVYRDNQSQSNIAPCSDIPPYTIKNINNQTCSVVQYEGKKTEVIHVNLDRIYEENEEIGFMEFLAKNHQSSIETSTSIANPHRNKYETISSSVIESRRSLIIPLKDDDSTLPHQNKPNSPTMTMFSRQANNDILGIFNKAAATTDSEHEDEKDDTSHTNYDGFVTETINIKQISEDQATPPSINKIKSDSSSPFLERPSRLTENNFEVFDPMDNVLKDSLMSRLVPPVSDYKGFHDISHKNINKLGSFMKITQNESKMISKGSKDSIISFLGDEILSLRSELGKGGDGTVYLVENEYGQYKAMKIEAPATKWEFYIMKQIHKRLEGYNHILQHSFIKPEKLFYFADESYLIMNYASQGTLLETINFKNGSMEEILVAFFTVELLKSIEALHSIGIIHGDIKPDNCMVRLSTTGESLPETYRGNQSIGNRDGWESRGISLIDFGRAIDLSLFKSCNPQFVAKWKLNEADCPQMHKGIPWKYEGDYFRIASVIHAMLYGQYIEIRETSTGEYRFKNSFKRYWQCEIWESLIHDLLNPPSNTLQMPLLDELRSHRIRLEKWLEQTSISRTLKHLILELESHFKTQHRKLIKNLQ